MFNDIDSIIKPLTKMVEKLDRAVATTASENEALRVNVVKIQNDIAANEAKLKRASALKKRISAIVEE